MKINPSANQPTSKNQSLAGAAGGTDGAESASKPGGNVPPMEPVGQEGMKTILEQGAQKVRSMQSTSPQSLGDDALQLRKSDPEAAARLGQLSQQLYESVQTQSGPVVEHAKNLVVALTGNPPASSQSADPSLQSTTMPPQIVDNNAPPTRPEVNGALNEITDTNAPESPHVHLSHMGKIVSAVGGEHPHIKRALALVQALSAKDHVHTTWLTAMPADDD